MKAQELAQQVGAPSVAPKNPQPPRTVQAAAEEYLAFRAEAERVEKRMAELKAFLNTELRNLPGQEIAVGTEIVFLVDAETRSLDWEAAKETLKPSALKPFEPFVKTVQKFELAAAEKVKDLSPLSPFIETKKTTQVRVKVNKAAT